MERATSAISQPFDSDTLIKPKDRRKVKRAIKQLVLTHGTNCDGAYVKKAGKPVYIAEQITEIFFQTQGKGSAFLPLCLYSAIREDYSRQALEILLYDKNSELAVKSPELYLDLTVSRSKALEAINNNGKRFPKYKMLSDGVNKLFNKFRIELFNDSPVSVVDLSVSSSPVSLSSAPVPVSGSPVPVTGSPVPLIDTGEDSLNTDLSFLDDLSDLDDI